MSGRREVDW
jgi:hypothetical protein